MRMLLLCAATFVAGLLAGTLVWHDKAAPRRSAPASKGPLAPRADSTYEDPDRYDREPGAARPETSAATRRPNARVGELAREAAAELDRIVTSERAEAILAGEGTISGTVRDAAGEPVAGVMVTVLPEARPFGLAMAARKIRERPHDDRDLSDVARDAIEGELWRRQARRTVSTGPDGRFELTGLMDSRHTLTAFHEGYDVRPLSQQGKVVPDAVVDFLARPVVEVRVQVRMPDGTLAEHAWLSWRGPHGNGWGPWTQEQDKARLPVGECKVKAQTSVPEPLQSPEVEHTVASQPGGETLVLQLEGRRVLTARLVLPEGFVLPRTVAYRLRRLVDNEEIDPATLLKDQSQQHAKSPSPGRAYWFELEPGRYLVAAFLDKRRLLAHAVAEVGEGPSEVELAVELSTDGTQVTVKVLGPDGGPVAGQASFHLLTGPENGSRYQRTDALQRDDGAWMVFLSGIDPRGSDMATLRVATRDYGSALRQVSLRGGTITVRFDKPARLSLRVDGYGSSGVEGNLYAALRGEKGVAAYGLVAPSGNFDFRGVQPDRYDLLLVVRRGKTTWPILKRDVRLRSGEEQMSVRVPALHLLRVRLAGKVRARSLRLRSSDPSIGPVRRDARITSRVVTFGALAAGSYEIVYGKKRVAVRVPGPEVTLE